MTTAESPTVLKMLQEINARLDEQAEEMTGLRKAFEIQFTRIAELQAELDVSPAGRRRRNEEIHLLSFPLLPPHNGNGRRD
jgi:hypothetical protein